METSSVKFCGYLFHRKQGTISLNNELFHLEHQQAKILNLLIDNRNEVVSREQIADQVWQGVIVEDNTISKAITRLRKVFNDSAKSPQIIKTIPKKGYQFIAALEPVTEYKADLNNDAVQPTNISSFGLKSAVAVAALVGLLLTLTLMQKFDDETISAQPTSLPKAISFREGIELNAHLHSDKKQLLFIGDAADGYGIFTKNVGEANARLLTPVSSRRVYPKWLQSSDASFVFSDLDESQQCQIYKFDPASESGRENVATCLNETPVEVFVDASRSSIVWSDNAGSWRQSIANSIGNGIENGKRQSLPYARQGVNFQMPSPNGELWATLQDDGKNSTLVVHDIERSQVVLEKQLPYSISHFKWSKSSDALYHLGEHPANQLFQLSLTGEHQLLASTSLGTMTSISDVQSPNTIEFVISSVDLDVHHLQDGQETKLINSPFADYNPVLSTPSNKLAFASKRNGSAQIWLQDENASLEQLSHFERASYIFDLAWSPDEKRLLVKRNDSIHIIDINSKEEQVLPVDAEEKVDWQWISNTQIAYVDRVSHSLFSIDLEDQNAALLMANVGRAQYVNDLDATKGWFISDVAGAMLHFIDTPLLDGPLSGELFSEKQLVSNQLKGRHWIVSAGKLYIVNQENDKPTSLVLLDKDGSELDVVSGTFNPNSLRATHQGGLIYHRMNRNEANIYQLQLR